MARKTAANGIEKFYATGIGMGMGIGTFWIFF